MQTVRIRQQGGALIVTIPRDSAARKGWDVGSVLIIDETEEAVSLKAAEPVRKPRGRFTVDQLLSQIDEKEIEELNASVEGVLAGRAGHEAW